MTTMTESLADQFAEHARSQPEAAALVWQGEQISYGALDQMASAADSDLADLGLPQDRPVGIRAKKSPQAIALILACLKQRRPFLLPSVELAPETLDMLFAQADVSRVLTPQDDASRGISLVSTETQADVEREWPPAEAGDISFMLTTSGSTGLPKIVPLPAAGVSRFNEWAATEFDIKPGAAVLNYAPLNFDLCLLDIWTTLRYGGCVVLVDQDRATNGSYLADLIDHHQVNVVQAVPMLYRLVIDAEGADGRTFPEVKHVLTTGDKLPPSSLKEIPGIFPNARICNIYGCTETNDSLMHEIDLSDGVPANIPVGQPLPGVDAMLLDEDGGRVEDEGDGEFVVWTPFQTPGYLKASLNADKFAALPDAGDGDKHYYRSGDIMHRAADGTLTIVGRSDFYVKVRGVRVSTQVVEQAIQEHPDVIECAVVAVPDELAGSRLHAVVRRKPDAKLNSLNLRQHMASRLARTEMPSTINIVTDPLPKTSTGKIDRKRCMPRREGSAVHG
jgi:acyl-coenzyme A synthetase/AMP-(fatty) acid ligase